MRYTLQRSANFQIEGLIPVVKLAAKNAGIGGRLVRKTIRVKKAKTIASMQNNVVAGRQRLTKLIQFVAKTGAPLRRFRRKVSDELICAGIQFPIDFGDHLMTEREP